MVKEFLVNRDETGREIVLFPETGKKYFIEYIGKNHTKWGDVDPATSKVTGDYGRKYTGSIEEKDSLIKEEYGFVNIGVGKGSPYEEILKHHNKYKATLR